MYYSIGEVAHITGITVSTLRYYDREGMFPDIKRSNGGIRVFSQKEINTLRIIDCLKTAGMSIKEIKEFLGWCQEGDSSLQKRREMFYHRLEEVKKQIDALQNTMNILKYKCWYYDTAIAAGSEDVVKNLSDNEIPEELQEYKV
ncbi:HTH-type transcriptional regulator AdhR [Clostridiales bacterium CHKCI001]|nr:HTH-type transcriptional regulator AdhR [Clostridiales bacterium CHKCI001]